ncbi:MAG: M42 family peptidase, partial [Anaerolineae bacterium]|nr:M42 family peptidase [Anaerolineae bacterium]
MNERGLDLLEKLCAIHAVSGREDKMTAFVRDYIRPLVDEVSVDNLGNVVGILKGSKYPDYRLMLQAHMDEIGLIIRNIDTNGFLQIERVGGVPEKSLLGQRVDVLTDDGNL